MDRREFMPQPNTRLNIITREEDCRVCIGNVDGRHHLLFFNLKRWEHLAKTRLERNKLARYKMTIR